MGKRNRRHHSTDDLARDRSLLDAIAHGELDDHLTALAEAVDARRRLLLTVRSATALAVLCVGDEVRINHAVKPEVSGRSAGGRHRGRRSRRDDPAAAAGRPLLDRPRPLPAARTRQAGRRRRMTPPQSAERPV